MKRWPQLERCPDELTLGASLVRARLADGCVAGANLPTRDVLRAALKFIGVAVPGGLVSSAFLMAPPGGRLCTFADCAVVPEPDATQLALIATTAAQTHRDLTDAVPVVALLSFSTKGSADHAMVSKVREATRLAQAAAPDLLIDGELQFDAAWVPAVGERKATGSRVAGRANVFVFPNLDAGNIGYKIAERLGGARAIGPLLQGLRQPMHDLSRGCSVDDVMNVAAACALQAARTVCERV